MVKGDWQKWLVREGVDLTTIVEIDAVFLDHVFQATRKKGEVFFTILKDRVFTHYTTADLQEVGRHDYKRYFPDKKCILDLVKLGNHIEKETTESIAVWKEVLAKTVSHGDLSAAFTEFTVQFDTVIRYFSIGPFYALEAWQNDCEKIFYELLNKVKSNEERQKISRSIYNPYAKTAIVRLKEDLMKGEPPKFLAERYQFLRSWSIIWNEPIDERWISSIKERMGATETLMSLEEIERILQPSKEELYFLELAPYMIFFKDYRDDTRRRQVFEWSFLFDRIAEFIGTERNDLGYFSLREISDAISNKKLNSKLLAERKQLSVVTSEPDKISMKIISGKETDKYLKIMESLEEKVSGNEISGTVACAGKANGPVCFLRSYKDIANFKECSILVAKTTHPNYLPAMQKAAAIVTDEGSIASHAAIVSRELKIPCIVGTKIATKVLKDGDLVEVNAESGVVKIIKRANEK